MNTVRTKYNASLIIIITAIVMICHYAIIKVDYNIVINVWYCNIKYKLLYLMIKEPYFENSF